jgi:predicted dehydrogenase
MVTRSDTVRVGIAGAGFAGAFHYDSLQRVRGVPVEVVGVTARTRDSREAFAAARGIRAFDTIDELIDACDVVDVCTPPCAHEEITVKAARAGRHVIVEKPFTGSFLNRGRYAALEAPAGTFAEERYREAVGSADRMAEAVRAAGVVLSFAENWHFLPGGLKVCRLTMQSMYTKTRGADGTLQAAAIDPGARILLIRGVEAHSGSTSPVYGDLRYAGGGSVMGKACHPLGFALYLKRLEGIVRDGKPVVPVAVSCRCGYLTSDPAYRDPQYANPRKIRRGYVDGEDWAVMVVRFADGSLAQVESNEFTLGGVHNAFEVLSNKFRIRGNLSPNETLMAYTPSAEIFEPEYIAEKLETPAGWSFPAFEENYTFGYIEEMEVFMARIVAHRSGRDTAPTLPYLPAGEDMALAVDSVKLMYAAYISDERKGAEVELAGLPA